MEKYRTPFGIWLSIFCIKRGINIAFVARELGLSHTMLSLIISGKQVLPAFLRENIIVTFCLHDYEIAEMDQSITATESEAVVVTRNYTQYVETNVRNQTPWTKDLMGMMAASVNSLTPEAAEQIKQILQESSKSSRGVSAEISKDVDIKQISKDLSKRYKKDPEKTEQILSYIKKKRG